MSASKEHCEAMISAHRQSAEQARKQGNEELAKQHDAVALVHEAELTRIKKGNISS